MEVPPLPPNAMPVAYLIADQGDKLFSKRHILAEILAGRLAPDVLIRKEGDANWNRVADVFPEIAGFARHATIDPKPRIAQRIWGYLLDSIIIGVPIAVMAVGGTLITVWVPGHDDLDLLLYVGFLGMGFVMALLYLVLSPLSPLKATIGMYFVGLRLTEDGGRPISLRASLIRVFSALLISGFCGIGYLWIVFDERQRTLHDRIAQTQVINVRL